MGLRWVQTSGNNLPTNALQGGFESNGTVLFVARAWNNKDGEWTPGKAGYHLDGCHFPYGGEELISSNYEVMTRDSGMSASTIAEWRSCDHVLPNTDRAVCTSESAGLYVSRGFYSGSLIPGKFDTVHRGNYVSYGGREFSCDDYEILYETPLMPVTPLMPDKLPTVEGKLSKYQHAIYDVNKSLQKGMVNLSQYVKDLKWAFTAEKDGFDFIKTTIFPSVDRAKADFDCMRDKADELVQSVNRDVEKCLVELGNKERTIKKLDKEIDQLRVDLEGKKQQVSYAKQQLRRKEDALWKANEALELARNKLEEAKRKRKTTKIVGGLLFLLGPVGWIAGSTALAVDATALKDRENLCRENRDDASSEVWSSKNSLDDAKCSKWKTENQISDRTHKKKSKERYLSDLRRAVDNLKKYQQNIIVLDASVKNVNKELTEFCGKFKVLHFETDEGYTLEHLKKPTIKVLTALNNLTKTDAVELICAPTELKEMMTSLLEVESMEWPSSHEIDY